MKLEYKNANKKSWFLITWDLSNKCNYRCSYCPSMFNDGSSGWPDWNDAKNFVKNINEQVSYKDICFRVSGGEPTYWKHFLDLAELVKSYGNSFSFLSNGSRDTNYFEAIRPFTDGIILSYHPEYSSKEHFIDIANVMTCPVAVNLMLTPDNFNEMVGIAEHLYSNSLMAVWPKVVLDKQTMSNEVAVYTEDQKEKIKNWPYFRKLNDTKIHRGELLLDGNTVNANDLILQGSNKHTGWTCWSGVDQINVSFEGNIYRADCQVGGSIGNIQNFALPRLPQICNKTSCNCLSDIYIRKEM
jgi:hypothetical protein